ncbi:MAG: lipopolysaccharide biosynthesis protein [Actinomycetota bacterium]
MEEVHGAPVVSDLGEDPQQPPLSKELSGDVRTVAKGGAVQLFGQVTQRSLSFFINAIAFRFLGASAFGIYRQVSQVLTIAGQVGLAGFNYAAMRFISRARAENNPAGVRGSARVSIVATSVASAVVVAGLVVAADPLSDLLADSAGDHEDFVFLFRIGAIYVPLFALGQVWRYATQAYKTMVPSVVAGNIIQPTSRFLLGLAVLLLGGEVVGLVHTLNASFAIAAVAAAIFFRRIMTAEERTARPHAELGSMIRFALPQGGSSLLGIQALGLGVLIIGAFDTNAQAGLFGIALMLQGPGNVFLGGIVNIWAPVVSDLHSKGEMARLESLYQVITRWVATFSFPVWTALILEPDLFIDLFVGAKGEDAAVLVAILAVGNIFYTGTGPTGYVLSMTGRPGINFLNSVVGVVMYVVGGLWAVPKYGAVGMAVVDAIVTASINSARVVEAKIFVGVQPFGRSILKPIAASAAGGLVLLAWRLFPGDEWWLELTGLVVAAVVYLATLKAMGIDAEERLVWNRIRKRAKLRRGRS